MANEILHYLKGKRSGVEGFAAFKIEIEKAYDKLEWDYLEGVMSAMGFDQQWINLVMFCVRTVSYHVIVGKEKVGPIIPSRGL